MSASASSARFVPPAFETVPLPATLAGRDGELDELTAVYEDRYEDLDSQGARRAAIIVLVYRTLGSAERTGWELHLDDRKIRATLRAVDEPILKAGNRVTPHEMEQGVASVRAVFEQGHESPTAIARELGWSYKYTLIRYKAAGLEVTRLRMTVAQREDVAQRLAAGESFPAIAQAAGVSVAQVRGLQKHLALPQRRPGVIAGRLLTREEVAPAAELHVQGQTASQIARALGMTPKQVRRRVERARTMGLLPPGH
jgi:DNA-binding CsgD family transcriptional regulator